MLMRILLAGCNNIIDPVSDPLPTSFQFLLVHKIAFPCTSLFHLKILYPLLSISIYLILGRFCFIIIHIDLIAVS